jgi:DNA-directed RNA polymerase specialized sigma24 family protein
MRRRNARGHGKLVGDALLRQVEDSAAALAEQFDTAWRQDQALLREAAERVQRRIGPQRWQAFWLVAMDNLKPAEVARRLGLKPTQVYDATFDVKEQLREELKALGFGQSQ